MHPYIKMFMLISFCVNSDAVYACSMAYFYLCQNNNSAMCWQCDHNFCAHANVQWMEGVCPQIYLSYRLFVHIRSNLYSGIFALHFFPLRRIFTVHHVNIWSKVPRKGSLLKLKRHLEMNRFETQKSFTWCKLEIKTNALQEITSDMSSYFW